VQQRRLRRSGHQSSVLIYGAAALPRSTRTPHASIQLALDAGINHFDVAASYGDAELRLGPWMGRIRDRIFLATKTGLRDRDAAWPRSTTAWSGSRPTASTSSRSTPSATWTSSISYSGRAGRWRRWSGPEEGLTSWVGITGHGHQAPATHLEALRRFPFETVLSPINYVLAQDPAYLAEPGAGGRGPGPGRRLMIIKSVARRNWPPEPAEHRYGTWYEPFDDQARISAAVAWAPSHPEVTGIATPGDDRLLPLVIEAERRLPEMSLADAEQVLARAADYSSPFIDIPI
jgi:hypothetical protein